MSSLELEALKLTIGSDTTSIPEVTKVESRLDVNPVSVIIAVSIVFILAPITISGNTMILAAFYRYKRLRTASNCLLASLAISDFGVGVFMPFGMHLELSGLPDNAEVSTVCIVPYCIVIALCSVSVLVTVAIAVDRLTSLAQPLRYKNIITHSSVEKYIAVFWLYAIAVGLSPLIYAHIMGITQSQSSTSCRFGAAVRPPVRVFLVIAVWAPSALVLLGCYMYVYLVARAHARAIYTVELSFRHQTQTIALPRYGQTLAVTVGAFLVLWLPFQACMLLDIFCGTKILSEWAVVWLGLPILGHSAANPWIYAFHHGEMRLAATKIAEDVVTRFGIHPSRYGCSPIRRGSNTNLELAEVNKCNDNNRPPIEDCFAARHQTTLHQREKTKCQIGELGSSATDISPEGIETRGGRFPIVDCSSSAEIIEENIHDLTNMLKPEYAIDRNHLIDSNHNIDKIKNLKYLLDPTFSKIRHLRRLNHKRSSSKTINRYDQPKFISYQNLKSDDEANGKIRQLNAMSDPTLNAADNPKIVLNRDDLSEILSDERISSRRRNSNLSSMSDPNIKLMHGNVTLTTKIGNEMDQVIDNNYGYSVQSLDQGKYEIGRSRPTLQCRRIDNLKKSDNHRLSLLRNFDFHHANCQETRIPLVHVAPSRLDERSSNGGMIVANRQITLTTNKLANMCNVDDRGMRNDERMKLYAREDKIGREFLRHSESIGGIEKTCRGKLLEPSRFADNLAIPIIHSEPPSPIQPVPLKSLTENQTMRIFSHTQRNATSSPTTQNPWDTSYIPRRRNMNDNHSRSPSRLSDPMIPYVLLNFEEPSATENVRNAGISPEMAPRTPSDCAARIAAPPGVLVPEELAEALLLSTERSHERRPSVFTEHDSTRFSSRRPSDLRWSESSRSQEILSNFNEHQKSPSSYSVNNFETCTSGSDLNDVTCLGSFVCPDALTSSLRESFFETPSIPNSDVFTSLEDLENPGILSPIVTNEQVTSETIIPSVHYSVSSANLVRSRNAVKYEIDDNQSKSSESVLKNRHRAILRLESSLNSSRPRVRPGNDCIIKDSPYKRDSRLAPLATPTPMDICTPTYDTAAEIKGASGLGVRV